MPAPGQGGIKVKLYVCKVCGHIEFGEAPDTCPVCGAKKEAFNEDAEAIKSPENPDELTDGDKKHIPEITVVKECGLIPDGECTDVHAKIGEIEHVMEDKHYIQWLDFYLDGKYISRVELTSDACHPAAALHLKAKAGKIAVIEHCNVHGNWMAEAEL